MTEFQFNTKTTVNRIMAYANQQHYLTVHQAKQRRCTRAALRIYKQQSREATLDIAVRVAIAIGIVAAGWFLTAIGPM